ncbi:outer membrane protein OmpK [Pelagibaculum spongiae]|uniref:Ion channel protein Tsx n=1 Tax=Pelagibaculum spongiae TaxID=2080658 RepID=A0A2V1GVN1_9GAMM|nr:outer membrane protein OmpK [Pelagibaculum spongiae]PVZ69751.1 hypothetical protein DC094_10665 [Pelagibaculum spongiae]
MKAIKYAAVAALAMGMAAPASADYLYGFGDVSVNYLDWSDGTEARSGHHNEFVYLELEGGAGFTWGEVYGFFDIENAPRGNEGIRTAYKGTIAYKTGLADLRLYGQHYASNSGGFNASNTVAGVSYNLGGNGWFFNPFIGFHHTVTTSVFGAAGATLANVDAGVVDDPATPFDERGAPLAGKFSGLNGGMFGWVGMYNFELAGQKFAVSQWHETEFGRKDAYSKVAVGVSTSGKLTSEKSLSHQGAVAAWWNITPQFATGVQYRYADSKLGGDGYKNAAIYTVKYNF